MEAGETLCFISVLFTVRRAFLVLALAGARFAFDLQQQVFIAFVGLAHLFRSIPIDCFETPAVFFFKYSKYLYPGEGGNAIILIDRSLCLSSFKQVCGPCVF